MIDSYLLSILRYVEVKVDIWCIDKTHFFSMFLFLRLGGGMVEPCIILSDI